MKTGIKMIVDERLRHMDLGYTPDHDEKHDNGELLLAAETYMIYPMMKQEDIKKLWPFEWESFNPSDRLSDLTKAGALIAAELDRLSSQQTDKSE